MKQVAVSPEKIHAPSNKATCVIEHKDYKTFFSTCVADNSLDLILTDPPYHISRQTGFKQVGKNSVERFAVSMDFGKWDHTEIDLLKLAQLSYSALRDGGTIIVWYDVWKTSHLAEALKTAGFGMLRLIVWNKTNPVPLNSKRTYLSNSREMAVVAVKKGVPTFNGEYDTGSYSGELNKADIIYNEPIPRHNGQKMHPTQKPLSIFEDLVLTHSNSGDRVCDPFVGSGTTAVASWQHNRHFIGCDIDREYVRIARKRAKDMQQSKVSKFIEIAQPDSNGFSRMVSIEELEKAGLGFGTGGGWCRDDGTLGKKYHIWRYKEGNKIVAVALQGYKKKQSKAAQFVNLAKPDSDGCSRAVPIEELEKAGLGNGGSWCRDDGTLGHTYNIERCKEGNKIVAVQLHGYKKSPIQKPIPLHIRKSIIAEQCVVLGIGKTECDHKDGRRDDPRLNDSTKVTLDDFQPLSKAVNNAKRQHCKECRNTDKRFDATRLGYCIAQWKGDGVYRGTCIGCYWHDPKKFNAMASKNASLTTATD